MGGQLILDPVCQSLSYWILAHSKLAPPYFDKNKSIYLYRACNGLRVVLILFFYLLACLTKYSHKPMHFLISWVMCHDKGEAALFFRHSPPRPIFIICSSIMTSITVLNFHHIHTLYHDTQDKNIIIIGRLIEAKSTSLEYASFRVYRYRYSLSSTDMISFRLSRTFLLSACCQKRVGFLVTVSKVTNFAAHQAMVIILHNAKACSSESL